MPEVKSARRNIMQLKKRSYRNFKFLLTLMILGFSAISMAEVNTVDAKIDKIQHASDAEKGILVEQLREDISAQKYNSTETNGSSENNISIDEKIQNRRSKTITPSKCGMGKCGMGKCGMNKKSQKSPESNSSSCD